VIEVGEPGLARAPRGGGAEVGPQTRWPSRLSALDRCTRWVAVTPAKRVEATRPKGRRSRAALPRILTPWSSTPSSQTRSIRCLSSAEAESTLETVLEDEPEWRDTLYIECVEFVTGRTELARRRRSAARADDLIAPPPTTRPLVVRRHLVAGDVVLGNRMGAPVREGGGVVAPCVNSLRMCKAGS
jgi:hypothetical protein